MERLLVLNDETFLFIFSRRENRSNFFLLLTRFSNGICLSLVKDKKKAKKGERRRNNSLMYSNGILESARYPCNIYGRLTDGLLYLLLALKLNLS